MAELPIIACDTEATGLRPYNGHRPFAFSLCDARGETEFFRLDGADRRPGLRRLREVFSGAYRVVFHNAKFDLTMISWALGGARQAWGVFRVPFEDTMLQAHLLRSDGDHGLKPLAYVHLNFPFDDETDVERAAGLVRRDYSRVPHALLERYARRDAQRTMLLHLLFRERVAADPALESEYAVELGLVPVTARMEARGLALDLERAPRFVAEANAHAAEVLERARVWAGGEPLDLGKDEALRRLLYGKLGAPVLHRTAGGKPSLDADTLAALALEAEREGGALPPQAAELVRMVVDYRAFRRTASMIQGYIDRADGAGTIHANINTCAAVTARESCNDPNLQNVEKDTGTATASPARRSFRTRPGFVHFHVDYSAIEFRLLVHYSGDPELVAEVNKPDGDPHALAAGVWYPGDDGPHWETEADGTTRPADLYGAPADTFRAFADMVGRERKACRTKCKSASFGRCYGAGIDKLQALFGFPRAVMAKRYGVFRTRWPRMDGLSRRITQSVKRDGYIQTAFGRKIYVPREKAYVGVNYLIQGTAASIMKAGQNRADAILTEEFGEWRVDDTPGFLRPRLLLPIHDEIIVEWPRRLLSEAPRVLRRMAHAMTDFPRFSVPLDVEVVIASRDWAWKRPYKIADVA